MLEEASIALSGELSSNERLLWMGQPRQGVFLRPADAFLIPFSLVWGIPALFGAASTIRTHAPLEIKLFGILFVLVGLYIVFGRFFFDARQRASRYYGVTTECVLIVTQWPWKSVRFVGLRNLALMSMDKHSDGTGTITFGSSGLLPRWMTSGTDSKSPPCFERIADVEQVYGVIDAARDAA